MNTKAPLDTALTETIQPGITKATVYIGSDRYAYTITEVSRTGHRLRLDHPALGFCFASRRKNGEYRLVNGTARVLVGVDNPYIDPSF